MFVSSKLIDGYLFLRELYIYYVIKIETYMYILYYLIVDAERVLLEKLTSLRAKSRK